MPRSSLLSWHTLFLSALGLGGCGGNTTDVDNTSTTGGGAGTGGIASGGTSGGGTSTAGNSNGGTVNGGSSGSANGGGPSDLTRCTDEEPRGGSESGLYYCKGEGYYHRSAAGQCPSELPRPGPRTPAEQTGCRFDSDCTESPHGHCFLDYTQSDRSARCHYGCVQDSDCSSNGVCLCDIPVGRCVPGSCKTDADCGDSLCVGTINYDGSGCTIEAPVYFACARDEDACLSQADCPGRTECQLDGGVRACTPTPGSHIICGRPFLIDGVARLAPLAFSSSSWSIASSVDASGLTATERAALATHWGDIGLMEHASVAAFARFTLELLALGAPAELVSDAQRAMGDEIEHAKLCFGLASRYAGRTVAPGALSIDGALAGRSRREIIRTAIREACIGETLAAIEAAEAAACAADPSVRAVLERITVDEGRHAELGWRFLRHCLKQATAVERLELHADLIEALVEESGRPAASAEQLSSQDLTLTEHGVLPQRTRHELRQAALEQVIGPLINALVDHDAVARCAA